MLGSACTGPPWLSSTRGVKNRKQIPIVPEKIRIRLFGICALDGVSHWKPHWGIVGRLGNGHNGSPTSWPSLEQQSGTGTIVEGLPWVYPAAGSWQASSRYREEAQYGSSMICYLIVCRPEGWSHWMTTHRGEIRCNSTVLVPCSRSYYFWPHGGWGLALATTKPC